MATPLFVGAGICLMADTLDGSGRRPFLPNDEPKKLHAWKEERMLRDA